jgi:hypothetical protein
MSDIKASHPFHRGIQGQRGGSKPSIHNNLLKACDSILPGQQAKLKPKLAGLKNPVGRLLKKS